jgi:hypothetical protein
MRRKIVVLVACVLSAVGFLALVRRDGEPQYGGRSLTRWCERLGLSTDGGDLSRLQAEQAISHIGTNAIPFLLAKLRHEPKPHPFRGAVASALNRLPAGFIPRSLRTWAETDPREDIARGAVWALCVLGDIARSAIPDLRRMIAETNSPPTSECAMSVLYELGSEGQQTVQAALEDPSAPNRVAAFR